MTTTSSKTTEDTKEGKEFLELIQSQVLKAIDIKLPDMAKTMVDAFKNLNKSEGEADGISQIKIDEYFYEYDTDHVACKVCTKYCSDFPKRLSTHLRGNYGLFLKHNTSCSSTNKERRKRLHEHIKGELHLWCVSRKDQIIKEEQLFKERNKRAANIIVTAAVQSALELDGSLQFIRLNNMLETLFNDFPTKNDGRENYFLIRDIIFHKLSENIKARFKNVEHACFTLDKVTVRRTPFTVLMTYFFYEGKIHVLLNSVHKMREEDYDGKGAAEMVGKVLMSTLDLSKDDVGRKYRHATYDGVYASPEERVAGIYLYNLCCFCFWLFLCFFFVKYSLDSE